MFRPGLRKKKIKDLSTESSRGGHEERKARRPFSVLRFAGNLLIAVGLLMMLGISGWWGYTQWSNQQYREQLAQKFGPETIDLPVEIVSVDTNVETTVEPTSTPLPPQSLDFFPGWRDLLKVKPVPDNSPPVRLVVSSVKIDAKVVPVTWEMIPSKNGQQRSEWQVADYAVGHHYGSANPGQGSNVVLSGHVDYKGEVFRELHNVNKGDEVIVHTDKGQYIYVISDVVLVEEEGVSQEQKEHNARFMHPTPDPTLTMITCWPYGIDDHRLIVIAKPYQSTLSTQSEYSIR